MGIWLNRLTMIEVEMKTPVQNTAPMTTSNAVMQYAKNNETIQTMENQLSEMYNKYLKNLIQNWTGTQDELLIKAQQECSFLFVNHTDIFNRIMKKEWFDDLVLCRFSYFDEPGNSYFFDGKTEPIILSPNN